MNTFTGISRRRAYKTQMCFHKAVVFIFGQIQFIAVCQGYLSPAVPFHIGQVHQETFVDAAELSLQSLFQLSQPGVVFQGGVFQVQHDFVALAFHIINIAQGKHSVGSGILDDQLLLLLLPACRDSFRRSPENLCELLRVDGF